jgi:hypothetical protein
MLNAKSKVIMRMLSNSQERGTYTHGQRVMSLSNIESVSNSYVRPYKLYMDVYYHLHFHQDYTVSVQVKIIPEGRYCPVSGQASVTDKRPIQLKTGNCKLGVL